MRHPLSRKALASLLAAGWQRAPCGWCQSTHAACRPGLTRSDTMEWACCTCNTFTIDRTAARLAKIHRTASVAARWTLTQTNMREWLARQETEPLINGDVLMSVVRQHVVK